MNNKKTFVLVHGAWEWPWSWSHTEKFLTEAGHSVVSVELPGHGDDTTPIAELSLDVYANKIGEELNKIEEKVILVAHSFGGMSASKIAEQMPHKIEKLVFIASAIPYEGKNMIEILEADEWSQLLENIVFSDDKSWASVKEDALLNVIFTGATQEQIDVIKPKLAKEATAPFFETVETTEANFGSIAKGYIECLEDKVMSPKTQRLMQEVAGIKDVIQLQSGHVPLETFPKELSEALITISK